MEWFDFIFLSNFSIEGFFFQPRPNARDRCVCFCCGLALVQWEPSEDPMTEHRKHAPACSFVRGFPTDNVFLPGVAALNKTEKSELEKVLLSSLVFPLVNWMLLVG